MQIEIVSSHKIDKKKWDECLMRSSNCLLYASSAYLDHLTDNWDGIIAGDYNFIMPVPWRKKFNIKYSYTVPFIQQLGVFGNNIQQEDVQNFLNILHRNFKYGDYPFNYANTIADSKLSNNYILMLSSKHSILKHFYQSHLEKNLSKAKNFTLHYAIGKIDETVELFKNLYEERLNIHPSVYKNFTALCHVKHAENKLVIRKIISNNETVSIALLMKFEERLYNLMSATTTMGRQQSAGAFLYDAIIKEFSQTGMVLDFEGSDIPGIDFFYKGFGAVNQPYCKMHFNNLSYPLRMFKR